MEIASSFSSSLSSSQPFLVALIFTALCFLLTILTVRSFPLKPKTKTLESDGGDESLIKEKKKNKVCNCSCSCCCSNGSLEGSDSDTAPYLNGGGGSSSSSGTDMLENRGGTVLKERQTGASMMEQLVPEIRTYALSFLDYPSLCRLSMTNSLMRKAANDDNAWKALYHKV